MKRNINKVIASLAPVALHSQAVVSISFAEPHVTTLVQGNHASHTSHSVLKSTAIPQSAPEVKVSPAVMSTFSSLGKALSINSDQSSGVEVAFSIKIVSSFVVDDSIPTTDHCSVSGADGERIPPAIKFISEPI